MLLIAAAIKLTSKGTVLFRQRRFGMDGKEFQIFKFRTMTVCEDGDEIPQATRNDPRVTRLGGALRRHFLDELPQLINVLQGRMSIVGPRPHATSHNERYRTMIRRYMMRHLVKPGMTGWAQVNGLRGETETLDKMKARVEHDLYYIRNWSVGFDLRIIARTVTQLFRSDETR
jgi:putative colanic acid biosynthesis UDP-glucose lipid carrier transferase